MWTGLGRGGQGTGQGGLRGGEWEEVTREERKEGDGERRKKKKRREERRTEGGKDERID